MANRYGLYYKQPESDGRPYPLSTSTSDSASSLSPLTSSPEASNEVTPDAKAVKPPPIKRNVTASLSVTVPLAQERERNRKARERRYARNYNKKQIDEYNCRASGQKSLYEVYDLKTGETVKDKSMLVSRPHPFDYDVPLTPVERKIRAGEFKDEVTAKEMGLKRELAADAHSRQTKSAKKQAKKEVTKEELGTISCSGCGNVGTRCHNQLYGKMCIDAVRRYHRMNKPDTEDIVAKKIFVDMYNTLLSIDGYHEKGDFLDDTTDLKFPPKCLFVGSYKKIMEWLKWKRDGMWIFKWERIPPEFHSY